MKRKTFFIFFIFVFMFLIQSCLTLQTEEPNIYEKYKQLMEDGRKYYKEYKDEHRYQQIKYTESKNFEKAIQCFQKAHSTDPGNYDPIIELLEIYWNVNLPTDFFYWMDELNNIQEDKYNSYVFSAKYCLEKAKMQTGDYKLENTNYDLDKVDYNSRDYDYVNEIYKQAKENGIKNFGLRLREKTLECLDNAYQIKPTSEILLLYSELYKIYGSRLRITVYNTDPKNKKVTSIICTVNEDLKKSQEYLEKAIQFDNNWEAHLRIYKKRMEEETDFKGGAYDYDKKPIYGSSSWNIKTNKDRVPEILLELDKAIEMAPDKEKAQLYYEKGNLYFFSFREYEKAKAEYQKSLNLGYNIPFCNSQLSKCDTQEKIDSIYLQCASILNLEDISDYFSWKRRTDYNNLYSYLNIGQTHQQYTTNDLIILPKQLFSITDVAYENGKYIYLVTGYGQNQLSKCCKIISDVQLNYISYYENLITEDLFLKYVGESNYKNGMYIERCDVFQNLVYGSRDYNYYFNKLLQVEELEKQIQN